MRRRPDDRPTGLPRAYSRQAVLITAFDDVVVATHCRTRLLDLALPVTHLASGRAVHERLPQLRPVRDKWVRYPYRSGVHRRGGGYGLCVAHRVCRLSDRRLLRSTALARACSWRKSLGRNLG